jgi:hypothetical protein
MTLPSKEYANQSTTSSMILRGSAPPGAEVSKLQSSIDEPQKRHKSLRKRIDLSSWDGLDQRRMAPGKMTATPISFPNKGLKWMSFGLFGLFGL